MGPIKQVSFRAPASNCVEFTITGSLTFVGSLTGPPVGFNPILVIDVANAQNQPAGHAASPARRLTPPAPLRRCRAHPGLFPQLGGNVRVPAPPVTATPSPTPTPTATPLIIVKPGTAAVAAAAAADPAAAPAATAAAARADGAADGAAQRTPVRAGKFPSAGPGMLLLGGLGLPGGAGARRRGRRHRD